MIELTRSEVRTPGGKWCKANLVDDEYCYYQDEHGIEFVVPCLDHSTGLDFAAECIKEPVGKKRNCPVLLTGDPGLGKSTVIISIARRIDPDFRLDQIAFTIDEFDNIFQSNPFGDAKRNIYPQANMDEAAHAMYGPEYLEYEQRTIAKNLIVSRIKKEIVYFATPGWKLLNPHTRNLVTIWIHVFEPEPYLQGLAILKTPPPDRQSEYRTAKYWEPFCAFTFPALQDKFWEEYESRKIAFVNSLKIQQSDGTTGSLLKDIVIRLRERGLAQTEIAEIIGRDRSRVSRYLSQRT